MIELTKRIPLLVLFALPIACDDNEKEQSNDKSRTGVPANPAAGSAPANQKPADDPGRTPPPLPPPEGPRAPGTANDDATRNPTPPQGGTPPRPPGGDTKTSSDEPGGTAPGS